MASKRDYYEVLGIAQNASDDDIKKAFRALAMKNHPDRNAGDEEAAARFKEASEAYAVLSDPQKRHTYDRYGHAGLSSTGLPDFASPDTIFDLFGDIFGGIFGGGRRRGPQTGNDLVYNLEIDLLQAAAGCEKSITFTREEHCAECSGLGCRKGTRPATCRHCDGHGVVLVSQGFFRVQQTCRGCGGRGTVITDPCATCRGRGRVSARRTLDIKVPSGAYTGLQLALRGEGEPGEVGGQRGDLIVRLTVREHPLFRRDGDNLICQVPITFSQAALGGDIEIATLDGTKTHAIKGGIQSGEMLRIPGMGMPNLRSGRKGDLFVVVVIETPKHLTKRQEELLRELAEIDQKHVSPQRKSFFEKIRRLFTSSEEREEAS